MEEIYGKIKYLINKKKTFNEICETLNLKSYELIGIIKEMHEHGHLIDYHDGEIIKLKSPKLSDLYEIKSDLEHLKLLLISDTHLASKHDRIDILNYLYDKAEHKGINHILHSGDFTDGRSTRPEHIYELKEHSFTGQVDYCVDKYPRYSGKTYVIGGNHDAWWYKSTGSDIVKEVSNKREDIIYLGQDVADMKIGKLKIRLFHGKGGSAYSKSYKIQRYVDAIPTEELPHILQTGHIHDSFYMTKGNTHCFQTSCLEDLTPYATSQGFSNTKSVWWVDIWFDNKGQPYMIQPTLESFGNTRIRK